MHCEVVDGNNSFWIQLLTESEQYNPFMFEEHLDAIGYRSHKVICIQAGKVVGGMCLPFEKDSNKITRVPYAPYQGILYGNILGNQYEILKKQMEISEVLITFIGETFKHYDICNHWSVYDCRAAQWYNYGEKSKPKIEIGMAYSAVKNIETFDLTKENISKRRWRDYVKSSQKYVNNCFESQKTDAFLDCYIQTFKRQGIEISFEDEAIVKKISENALQHGYGKLYYIENANGEIMSALLMLYDKTKAYYMFGANLPEFRDTGAATQLMLYAIAESKKMGLKYFDFVGANSPHRGDFKLSFNAELKVYYTYKLQ